MSLATVEYSQTVEINTGGRVKAMTFTANGEYIVSGGDEGVQVWRVNDGERVVTIQVSGVRSVSASKDGKFFAAGSSLGDVWVWDAVTHEQVFSHKFPANPVIYDVDFSPDSTRLISANGGDRTATIWDFPGPAREKVRTLNHREGVLTAKYSSQGDRIATATERSVRAWDGNDGRLLVNMKARLNPWRGLLWFNNYLFVKTGDSKIRQIDTSTGSTVSEWSVPSDFDSCISLPQHGQFMAYSTKDNITFWDTSTFTQIGLIPRSSTARVIVFSLDNRVAVVGEQQKIFINELPFIAEPHIRIEAGPLHAWKNGQLTKAEALLTTIARSGDTVYHVLASRALVRARLRQWDAALVDAEESINIQSSAFGYIAKCVALVGKGGAHAACRIGDVVSLLFHSDHVAVLLLVKAVALFMVGEHDDAISRIDDFITVRPLDPMFYVVQAYMLFLRGNLYIESGDYSRAIQSFENAQLKLGSHTEPPPLIVLLISGWNFDNLAITIQRRLCETLFVAGRTKDAGETVLRIVGREINMSESIWVVEFMQQCLSVPGKNYDVSSASAGRDSASCPTTSLLKEWMKLRLSLGSWEDALASASGFTLPKVTIYQAICEHLEMMDRVTDAVSCFCRMYSELAQDIEGALASWIPDFKSRCCRKLEALGDIAMNTNEYDQAILRYMAALSLNPASPQGLLGKRSEAHAGIGQWEDALNDANEVIKLDPSFPLGYEKKHEALHGMGRYGEATSAFETMLSKMLESSDPEIRERSRLYLMPEKTKDTIRMTIKDTIRDTPLILINTISGRLCDKSEQAAAFELTPAFSRLISTMTTHIVHASVTEQVGEFYRYATFSHKWEDNEPLFERVIRVVVYDLEASPTHEKLQMFCKVVREAGFNWAWSDTCCINKGDHFMLQEALVSMFKWYERSAMTIIFLRGVNRMALRGALTRSIWNMRAWTLQEYHASNVVRIYTEDWTPYLGLEINNYKESPEIISEMEEATGIPMQALMALRPGLNDIRVKLRLASTRETTRVEDAAYSLLGIFALTLPITYGEGDHALGRLLSQLLASSGDMGILAWTGRSGSFNSCLPSSITVFSDLPTSHIPSAISDAEMGFNDAGSRSLNLASLTTLYDRVNELPLPSFSGLRMKLPCLAFKLGPLSVSRNGLEYVFRAQTKILGVVEIRTGEDLSLLGPLYLVNPWIDYLLDSKSIGSVPEKITEENGDDGLSVLGKLPSFPGPSNIPSATGQTRTARLLDRLGRTFGRRFISPAQDIPSHTPATSPTSRPSVVSIADSASLSPPSTVSSSKKQMRVLRFGTRLRQPFGALLLTGTHRNKDKYRRVAAESLITVQVKEFTPEILDKLINSVRMLDVL